MKSKSVSSSLAKLLAATTLLAATACGPGGGATLKPDANAPNPTNNKSSGGTTTALVNASAEFSSYPVPAVSQNPDGSAAVTVLVTIQHAVFSPALNDSVNLALAATKKIVSPKPNGCRITTFALSDLGLGPHALNISGFDPIGSTACREFLGAVAQGLKLEFTSVPYTSLPNSVVQTLDVTVANPYSR